VGLGRPDNDQRVPDSLAVRTVPLPDSDDLDLLGSLPAPGGVAWVRGGEGLAGWGEAARITLPAGVDRFTAAEKWLRVLCESADIDDQVGLAGCGLVAFGSFTFDPASDGSVLIVPQTVLGRSGGRAWRTDIGDPATLAGTAPAAATEPHRPPPDGAGTGAAAGPIRWHDGGLSAPDWERAVAAGVDRIRSGELGKVVLARDLYATAPGPFDTRLVLRRLAARYPDCYTFSCDGLTGATPELLIRRDGRQITSLVLAGTAPRGGTAEQDLAFGAGLLASAKNQSEHVYAVDSVRDVLAPLCEQLDIEPGPSLLRLANVQHLATAVRGVLTPAAAAHRSALALAAAQHPTAAVGGTPTGVAMDLIRELEGMDRGRYAGPVGWVDGRGNGVWGIALRCALLNGPSARLFAGCGIVADSDPAAELAEAQSKFRVMQDALDG
jgi:menaquinone-specific isochorismate synthase